MGINLVDKSAPTQGQHVDANGSAQVMLYDQFGNPLAYQNKTVPTVPISGVPPLGLDGDSILRIPRVSEFASLATTSAIMLWQDAFESSTVNAFWTQSTTTMTIAQSLGVMTLNNSGITTASTDAIITSQRQFQKYPRMPIWERFKANISANAALNHTFVELGFGAPTGTTAVISYGAFFRWTSAGNLVAVTSYNGTENVSATLVAQGSINTASYYYYDVIMDDDFARFIVSDSNGTPIVDTTLRIPTNTPYIISVSHVPTFARVYVDTTGGGTAIKLNLSGHTVQMLDGMFTMSFGEQMASVLRQASINPTTYAQTGSSMTAAPSTITPSNTAGGYNNLGGDYAVAVTTASENPLSVFGFQIPSPYTFMLRGLAFSIPFVTTAISVTGTPLVEWLAIANCASADINTGGGFKFPLGVSFVYTSSTQAAGTFLTNGGNLQWLPETPIPCLPGTFLHLGYKLFITSAAGTPGVTRGSIFVDGYFN